MALVAYENSDSSDYEDEDSEVAVAIIPQKEVTFLTTKSEEHLSIPDVYDEDTPKLFNQLPLPTQKKPEVIEEDDEFLHKKESASAVKHKTKITVPSLSDFKDVETTAPNVKPRVTNGKKSGLLSMLPQPRNAVTATTKSLIPYSLTKKPNNPVKKKVLPSPMKKVKVDTKLTNECSDESDTEEVQNDFFSINKPNDIPPEDVPFDTEQMNTETVNENETKVFNIESYFKPDVVEDHIEVEPDRSLAEYTNPEASVSNEVGESSSHGGLELDDEAILKLCGTRGKRKREEIQIVDVNQREVLGDAREWMLKSLMDDTTKRVSASKKKGNEPTSQQKRKHQITYLAHQAKANEAELQNQWANNRMTRRQTQSKYGF